MTTLVISALVAAALLALLGHNGLDLDFGAREIALRRQAARTARTSRPTAATRRFHQWPWHRAGAHRTATRAVPTLFRPAAA